MLIRPGVVLPGLLPILAATVAATAAPAAAPRPPAGWKHSGTITLLTTPDGANLPAGAVVENFPVLVRLTGDGFDFRQALPGGADLRFTDDKGGLLAHHVEEWDAGAGTAAVWVRVPRIEGNAVRTLHLHWGRPDAADASDGKAVFNESNGFVSVWHMGDGARDEVGTAVLKDSGTTPVPGVIGAARRFDGKAGLLAEKLAAYPTGDSPSTTEAWFRADVANGTIVGWGNNVRQGKVVMLFQGPPHINMDCWFSSGNVKSTGRIPLKEWNHVAHVFQPGDSRVYVNGVLAGTSRTRGSPLNVASPMSVSIGTWARGGWFVGDLDEVRISKVARTAEWVRLQYENQKPMQTLVGPLVRPGNGFAVTPDKAVISEGGRAEFAADVGGARKLSWSLVREGREELLAVDRYRYALAPGRVSGDATLTLRLRAVCADGVKVRDIPVTVTETVPDPEFTLSVPDRWDGRTPIDIVPQITNAAAMKAAGAGDVRIDWQAGPMAIIREQSPGRLRLVRSQNSGRLRVTASISNGGTVVTRSGEIEVTEPAVDAWVHRMPDADEKPEDGQFYPREDGNEGTLHYNGTLAEPAAEVFLKVFCDDKPFAETSAKPGADRRYALSIRLRAGLVKYRVEFGTRTNGVETVVDKVGNLLCGDAFLIEGQSNAEALDLREMSRDTSEWIRTYGGPMGNARDGGAWLKAQLAKSGGKLPNLWRPAVWKSVPQVNETHVGWWGMQLALKLVEGRKVPVCVINGALGGTRIDEHQRNPADPTDLSTIYGRWLWRLRQARLTHGIRAVIWHQGENDQPAAGPSGEYGWVNYHRYFIEMAAAWKRDMPNVRHYYAFQIWPNSCGMGGPDGAGDRLREQQRRLPELFSNLSVMSTLGIRPPGGCHFPLEGYNQFARLIRPLVERDIYGVRPAASITPPNLRRAAFTGADRTAIVLEFDQPVVWNDNLAGQFYLDGAKDKVAGGSVDGTRLTLKLKDAADVKTVTYLKESAWSQDTLLTGANGIAALTFCEVPIDAASRADSKEPRTK